MWVAEIPIVAQIDKHGKRAHNTDECINLADRAEQDHKPKQQFLLCQAMQSPPALVKSRRSVTTVCKEMKGK